MRVLLALAAATFLTVPPARAALDDDDRAWLLEVKPILLDHEEKLLASLRTKADRLEFRKIFWAMRDPDLLTDENEFKLLYEARRPEADKRFFTDAFVPMIRSTDQAGVQPRVSTDPLARRRTRGQITGMEEIVIQQSRDANERPATPGALTDCGLFYIVLGEPDEVQDQTSAVGLSRPPRVWVYAKRNSRFLFDGACLLPPHNEKLREKVKEQAIVQPAIEYHIADGELLKTLAEMMPRSTPAAALLKTPRQDFPVETETYFLKGTRRTSVIGLLRGDAGALFREEAMAGRVRLLVRAELTPEGEGGAAVVSEREMLAEVDAHGAFLASYRVGAKPGSYTLRLAVLDANNQKGSVVTHSVDVPDFGRGSLTIASLLALASVEERPRRDSLHPLESFRVGDYRFHPRFGNVFRPSESLTVSYQFYDPKTDAATHQPHAVARLRILREDGSLVAEGPADVFETAVGGTFIGPIALAKYAPGSYRIRLDVADKVEGATYTETAAFEIAEERPLAAAGR
jgi:hypothetical protein